MNADRNDPLRNILSYNGEMTISQVVRFFDRQGLAFTKTMIQSFVRIGVLPPPRNKRIYTRAHLVLLVLIEEMKGAFNFDELKKIFGPIIDGDPEYFPDRVEFMMEIYGKYRAIYSAVLKRFGEWANQGETENAAGNEDVFFNKLEYMSMCIIAKEKVMNQ